MESQKISWFQTTNQDNYGKISIGIEPTQIGTTVSNEENNENLSTKSYIMIKTCQHQLPFSGSRVTRNGVLKDG